MEDKEFLKEVNDRIVLSVDEPIYQSVERFLQVMSEQLSLSPQEIKDALDFSYLAKRQRALARPLIEAFVKEHPYDSAWTYEAYGEALMKEHPGIHASMIQAYLEEKQQESISSAQQEPSQSEYIETNKRQTELENEKGEEAPLADSEILQSWKRLAALLRLCGKIIFWFFAVIGFLAVIIAFRDFMFSDNVYFYGSSYLLSLLLEKLFAIAVMLFSAYVFILILNALACLLDRGHPSIPFHHFDK